MLKKIFRTRHSGVPGLVFFVCLSVAFAPFLMAQTTGTGALSGKVIDASRAAWRAGRCLPTVARGVQQSRSRSRSDRRPWILP